jgi:hypothetical protein
MITLYLSNAEAAALLASIPVGAVDVMADLKESLTFRLAAAK